MKVKIYRTDYHMIQKNKKADKEYLYKQDNYLKEDLLLESLTYDNEGTILEKTLNSYDEKTRLLKEEHYNELSNADESVSYVYQDNTITRVLNSSSAEEKVIDHLNAEKLIEKSASFVDGQLVEISHFEYNEHSKLRRHQITAPDGKTITKTDIKYNDTGEIEYERETDEEGRVSTTYFEYDEKQNLILKEKVVGDEVVDSDEFYYDDKAQLIRNSRFDEADKEYFKRELKYDGGNVILEVIAELEIGRETHIRREFNSDNKITNLSLTRNAVNFNDEVENFELRFEYLNSD